MQPKNHKVEHRSPRNKTENYKVGNENPHNAILNHKVENCCIFGYFITLKVGA